MGLLKSCAGTAQLDEHEAQLYDSGVHPRADLVSGPVKRHVRAPSTIRGALVAGFVTVFIIWAFSAYDLVRGLTQLETRAEETRTSFVRGEQVLSTIRTSVLLGSVYLRDALVDSTAITRQYYRDELKQIRDDIGVRLPAYAQSVHSPLERQQWALLQTDLDDYWAQLEVVFGPEMPRNSVDAAAFLRQKVVPRRDRILRILDRLAALRAIAAQRHEIENSLLYVEVRQRLLQIGGLAILLGLVVAAVATWHVGCLEREIVRQRTVDLQNRRDLERLSARLVSAQEEERRVIARELHDEVGQALTAIRMELSVAHREMQPGSRAASLLAGARSIAESALHSVRDISQLLHPSMLDDLGLPDTIDTYLRAFSKRTGIRTQLVHEQMDERLPPDVEVCVYRIVQEALTNIAKHSSARTCVVHMVRRDSSLQLVVEDDGRGIDPGAQSGSTRRGLGIIGMRERAAGLAGTFSFHSRDEGGTRVVVLLPLLPAAASSPVPDRLAG
jgi:two-component system sensor histidine kinase UhpB